jgi:acyl-CoA hydrolase
MIKTVADSFTIMTEMIMPNDTNPLGNLMGGNLLRLMDIAGAICAGRHCEAYVVTASVDHVSFTEPIHLGEVITLECSVTRAWTTSVEVYVEVWAADVRGKDRHKCNHAYFTFVGLDAYTKKPTPVPAVSVLGAEQQLRYDAAERRREVRLILAGRMKPSEASNLKALFGED